MEGARPTGALADSQGWGREGEGAGGPGATAPRQSGPRISPGVVQGRKGPGLGCTVARPHVGMGSLPVGAVCRTQPCYKRP